MSITIQLDQPALLKLIELGGPEFETTLRQAAVAEITRRAFTKYLPDEIKAMIDREVIGVRKDLLDALRAEKLVETMLKDRIESAKRGLYIGNFIPDSLRKEAQKLVDETIGATVRKITLEQLEAPEGVQQFVDQRCQQLVDRITAKFEGEALERRVEDEIRKRVDALVQERVAAVIAGLSKEIAA